MISSTIGLFLPVGFHPDYGVGTFFLDAYKITDVLYEFPMSCLEMFGKRLDI